MARRTRTLKLFKTRLAPVFPVTAFAAVSLTLVVVFMIMSPLTRRYAQVSMPVVSATGAPPLLATTTLTLELNGAVLLDGRLVPAAELKAALTALAGRSPQPVLTVRGDRGLTYRQIKTAMDTAQAAGLKDIRLEVARAPGTLPAQAPASR